MSSLDTLRRRATLRLRLTVGLVVAGLLVFVAGILFFRQLAVLDRVIRELRVEDDRLTLALDAAHRATDLVVVVQEKTAERIPALFAREVGAAVRALEARRDELRVQAASLPEGDPLRDRIEEVAVQLQNLINVAEGTIRHAEDENWPAVGMRSRLLLANHNEVEWEIYQLVALSRDRRSAAEAQAAGAMQRMITGPSVLLVIVLVAGALMIAVNVRTVIREAGRLSQSARRLAAGRFDERIPVIREDEFGQLARSFNRMAAELEALYAGLERRVAERTADLERRSLQLEAAAQVAREAA
ncbi:MAG TPA: HAMP domain-containing protein, partial [Anaerolineae bacterium]|nr:HAMP domain-containing protein [Anaerolineae bacterium]